MRLERFQLIDRVEHLDRAAKSVVCRCEVPRESSIFDGHFPGHPLFPGTLMIEAIAQASGLLVLVLHDFRRMPVLIAVNNARVRGMVKPGAVLAAEGKLVQEGSGYVAATGHITHDGKKVAEAEIRLGTLPFPLESLRAEARKFAKEVGLI
ncbi:MAG TPA: 3-hydroxyacyl-ACP dehydratase FabZ family protein [Alphaproteobacteria bacterium]|jgi:3-hydroxyacyl-[acyl-carrier-protein] dehydratase